jgi:hypothetical protein
VLDWLGICAGGGQTALLAGEIYAACALLIEITLDTVDEELSAARVDLSFASSATASRGPRTRRLEPLLQ